MDVLIFLRKLCWVFNPISYIYFIDLNFVWSFYTHTVYKVSIPMKDNPCMYISLLICTYAHVAVGKLNLRTAQMALSQQKPAY